MVIRCKRGEADCGSDICCKVCDDNDQCKFRCGTWGEPVGGCADEVEESDPLEIMEKAVPDKIKQITDLVIRMKEAEKKIESFKEELLKAMEANGVKSFDNGKVSFTYVAPTVRMNFDKSKLEKEHPELDLNQYQKPSNVKASVRIKVK